MRTFAYSLTQVAIFVMIGAGPVKAADPDVCKGDFALKPDAITDLTGIKVGHSTVTQGTHRGTTVVIPGEHGGIASAESIPGWTSCTDWLKTGEYSK